MNSGGPGRARTSALGIRNPLLYPAELRALNLATPYIIYHSEQPKVLDIQSLKGVYLCGDISRKHSNAHDKPLGLCSSKNKRIKIALISDRTKMYEQVCDWEVYRDRTLVDSSSKAIGRYWKKANGGTLSQFRAFQEGQVRMPILCRTRVAIP